MNGEVGSVENPLNALIIVHNNGGGGEGWSRVPGDSSALLYISVGKVRSQKAASLNNMNAFATSSLAFSTAPCTLSKWFKGCFGLCMSTQCLFAFHSSSCVFSGFYGSLKEVPAALRAAFTLKTPSGSYLVSLAGKDRCSLAEQNTWGSFAKTAEITAEQSKTIFF